MEGHDEETPKLTAVQRKNLAIDKYRLLGKIGEGAFGKVYEGMNTTTKKRVAIKIELIKNYYSVLSPEYTFYSRLPRSRGICEIYYHGKMKSGSHILVMELLGKSLESLFDMCKRRFSVKTVTLLADQMLDRLRFLHSMRIIHRDIKPDNFAMGLGNNSSCVYIIDFGLSKCYRNSKNLNPIMYGSNKNLLGTARYASINAHSGCEQSRRDDLESLGYVLVYFLKGSLPWQGLKLASKEQKYEAIAELKSSTPIKDLCKGLPNEFAQYLRICRDIAFDETPPYEDLIQLFRNLAKRLKFKFDFKFDWSKKTKDEKDSKAIQEDSKKEPKEKVAVATV